MNVRVRKTVKAGSKAKVNVSGGGVSLSIPLGILTLNLSKNGVLVSSTPATGITLQERIKF